MHLKLCKSELIFFYKNIVFAALKKTLCLFVADWERANEWECDVMHKSVCVWKFNFNSTSNVSSFAKTLCVNVCFAYEWELAQVWLIFNVETNKQASNNNGNEFCKKKFQLFKAKPKKYFLNVCKSDDMTWMSVTNTLLSSFDDVLFLGNFKWPFFKIFK